MNTREVFHSGLVLRTVLIATGLLAAAVVLPLQLATPQVALGQGPQCENEEYRVGSSANLPDCRAYELVSPPDKEGGATRPVLTFVSRFQAAASGEGIAYPASVGFGDTNSVTTASWYKASRSEDGWTSTSLMPPAAPFAQFVASYGPLSLDAELERVVHLSNVDADGNPLLDGSGEVVPGTSLLFEDLPAGSMDMLMRRDDDTTGALADVSLTSGDTYEPLYFAVPDALTDDAPGGVFPKVYKYENGSISLASIAPDGTPIPGDFRGNNTDSLRRTSTDGRVLFFSGSRSPDAQYRREGDETVRIDDSEDPLVSPGVSLLRTVGTDGLRAFFTSSTGLVESDDQVGTDLFRYKHSNDPENDENLTLISRDTEPADGTSAEVGGVVGSDDAGKIVYFVSQGQLVAGQPTTAAWKLYRWEDGPGEGTLEYLTGLENGDADMWMNSSTGFDERPAQVSADGRYIAAITTTALAPGDNGGFAQIYVYDRESDEWTCASCHGDGSSSTSEVSFRRNADLIRLNQSPTRNLSTNGHVFFETKDALVNRDTNGESDVYVWKDGEVDLISSGRASSGSFIADVSEDGSTPFFVTTERLTPWDTDSSLDIYAARVGGGFAPPPPAETKCSGDECQGEPQEEPANENAGSSEYQGSGNASADRPDAPRSCSRFAKRAKRTARKSKELRVRAKKANGATRTRVLKRKARAKSRQAKRQRKALTRCRDRASSVRD